MARTKTCIVLMHHTLVRDIAVLLASNDAYFPKCSQTVRELRTAGKYMGVVEYVAFDNGALWSARTDPGITNVRPLNLVVPDMIPSITPCIFLAQKRRVFNASTAYLHKSLVTMSPWWKALYRMILYLDCGCHVHNSIRPLLTMSSMATRINNPRFYAHSNAYPTYEWSLRTGFHKKCSTSLYAQLESEYALDIDYFQSTIMLYDTRLLQNLSTLISLYKRFGPIADGDQDILSLYFVNILRRWTPLSVEGPHCYYDYLARVGTGCRSYIITKI